MHYLGATMMARHLLALFALFSGIAALNAPAHANSVQSLVENTRTDARAGQSATSESCACPERARENRDRCPSREKRKPNTWLPAWLRPSVILGSDRSLE